ncbi:glycosyltransferase family 4 protein [Rhodoferax sp. GW822-FHT02A01]|uniref:glycosyltransferase family 4 protein n=1 Tax=Rhodoferax sp. GW822-FHT02A01 TaxID=3141537 RepID=UPI00315DEE05
MKITVLQGAFLPVPPALGGACEKMWFLLGQKFAARGHQVAHVSRAWQGFPAQEHIQGVVHLRVRGYQTPTRLLWLKLLDAIYTWRAIRAIPPDTDVVVTNTFWAPLFIPLFRSAKVYVDVARMPKGQMRLYSRAARLRANSTPVLEAIRAELPIHRKSQASAIPNPLPYEPAHSVEWAGKQSMILFCGRLHPEKGLDLLAQTVNALPPGWVLTLVGPWKTSEGGGGATYVDHLRALFDPAKVRFEEPVYDIEKLNQFYQRAAIFVYPSVAEKGETFGLAPLEAMAWGAVPVVSSLSCFRDFIHDGDNGLFFDHRSPSAQNQLAQCVLRLVEDTDLRSRLAARALQVRHTHSATAIADSFLADFEKLLVAP